MSNQEIARLLRHVAACDVILDEKKYRFQITAYQKAADSIESQTTQIKDFVREGKLDKVPGVGASIKSHLEELIKTGRVKHFIKIMKSIPKPVFPLLEIPRFGPKTAYKLVKKFSLKNEDAVIDDIENLAKKGKIAELIGFGEKSQQDLLQAIIEYKQGKSKTSRMVLPYAFELAEKIITYLKKSKYVLNALPLGSLRRMAPTVGDIDIAVATNEPSLVIDHFVSYPYKERVIEKGPTTASILTSGGKQIDLMTQQPHGFGALLQHFTGSKSHNVHLREYALTKGLSLSEHGIKQLTRKDQMLIKYDSEEKFYEAIDMQWIPPEMREDNGEIKLAINYKLPKLVELLDIRGDLHIHSNYPIESSHDFGQDSMKDMLINAKSLRYEYLGFSEHNPSISRHNNLQIYNIIARRNEYIEQIKSDIKNVRIIKLLEIDILVDGNVAIDSKTLELLDGAIVSVHSSFGMDKKDITKRIIKGLSHPKAKILAHPTGRMLNQRAGYEVDFELIFDFCKKNNKALEINGWPNRLDPPDNIIKEGIKNGIKFVINTDSHALQQMNLMRYGVAMARRGWAKNSDILNTLVYNDFIKWLKK
ncbi:MAG: hypothetical protein AAB600_03505 [Patescibacteria group bacterium]